ncbi:bromodomain adjacent to zinc finger domain protein 1A-like [Artemia franciscana]|uniref:Bromodomain adjacent to zinc finger domain protein 1A n=1 Tax=Artemia franciscana TaxID=6661 RepID=A0AA88H8U5_ARTSF|nr:hypothetical protein QYM36_015279 [Artemia franciscana]
MPLLRKEPFYPNKRPENLSPDDEVFICQYTNEIFTDYEGFFERSILCNSLIWSCSLTGKSNLTYDEALQSEQNALKNVIETISKEIRRLAVFLATLIKKKRLTDVMDDVHNYIRDRYVVGEEVEAIIRNKWYPCKVVRVIPPTDAECQAYLQKQEDDPEVDKVSRDRFIALWGPLPELFRFEVEEEEADDEISATYVVPWSAVRREKGFYTRDKLKMYLRYIMHYDKDLGIYTVADNALGFFDIQHYKFEEHFPAKIPEFSSDLNKNRSGKKETSTPSKTPSSKPLSKSPTKKMNNPPVKMNGKTPSGVYDKTPSELKKEQMAFDSIPENVRKPVIYLLSRFKKYGINSIFEELYQYMKDRIFIGEDDVEAIVRGMWRIVKVVRVIEPTNEQVEEYCKAQDTDPDIDIKVRDENIKVWGPQPELFRFVVVELEPDRGFEDDEITVDWTCIRREKTSMTRDRLRLMIRHVTQFDEEAGHYKLKDEFAERYDVQNCSIKDFFPVKEPEFVVSIKPRATPKQITSPLLNGLTSHRETDKLGEKKTVNVPKETNNYEAISEMKASKLKQISEKRGPEAKPGDEKQKQVQVKAKKILSAEEVQKMEEEMKRVRLQREKNQEEKRLLMEKQKQEWMEARQLEKQKKLEEKKKQAELQREMKKPKEDLELDNLKELPMPNPVRCRVPNALFGDFLMILEFLQAFAEEVDLKDDFTQGVDFDLLERAVAEKEILGPFNDLIQVLLRAIFSLQEQENEEIKEDGAGNGDTVESRSTKLTYGLSLQHLNMDALTLTEMLRLHILQSGSKTGESNAKWRFQQRGGYISEDDPGYDFKREEPQILQRLATHTVFELSMGDKLKVLKCLMLQILTYAATRDELEDRFNQLHSSRNEVRNLQAAEKKRQREVATERANQIEEDKKKDPPLTAEAIEAKKSNWDKEDLMEKENFNKSLAKLKGQIEKLELTTNLEPLGRDRAYRRFWTFSSLPGLFVEHDDEFVGPCSSEPTPYNPDVDKSTEEAIQKVVEKPTEENALRQVVPVKKENDIRQYFIKKGTTKEEEPAAKADTTTIEDDIQAIKDSVKERHLNDNNGEEERKTEVKAKTEFINTKFLGCTANQETCPVHATYITKAIWYYYENPIDLDILIECLSERGLREGHLKTHLSKKREEIKSLISTCPVHKLDNTKETTVEPERKHKKKKEYLSFLGHPEGTPINDILENELRENLLDIEDKIFTGGLGALKVNNREAWIRAIENNSYDRQADKLKWGGRLHHQGLSTVSGTPMKDMKGERPDSGLSETSSEDATENRIESVNGTTNRVKDLASALLQISQSVEEKFLKKPLGEDEKEKKKRLKMIEEKKKEAVEIPPVKQRTPRERWEVSLLQCTSFPQIFLHLSSLDASIQWNKSIEKIRCRVCRKKSDPEKLLICDNCNKGCHTYCLKPPLAKVPEGDWFCKDCQPKEKQRTPRKARRLFSEEEEEAESEEEEEAEEEEEEDEEEGPMEVCTTCSKPGEVILCDTCSNMYHLTCLEPPLRKPPRGKWSCPECLNPKAKRGKARARAKTIATDKPERENRKRKATKALEFSEEESDEEIASKILPKRKAAEKVEEKIKESRKRGRNNDEIEESEEDAVSARPARRQKLTKEEDKVSSRRRSEPAKSVHHRSARGKKSDYQEEESEEESMKSRKSGSRRRVVSPEPEESEEELKTNNNMNVDIEIIEGILDALEKHRDSWPFLSPVKKSEAPDYHEIIKHPMDLATLRRKLYDQRYKTNADVLSDIVLLLDNCERYNVESADEYKCGVRIRKFLEKKLADLGLRLPSSAKETEQKR